jgi:hypothetical protein
MTFIINCPKCNLKQNVAFGSIKTTCKCSYFFEDDDILLATEEDNIEKDLSEIKEIIYKIKK